MSLGAALAALEQFYGVLPPPPGRLFSLFVWEVLGAQTSPGRRDAAFAALKRIPALTPDAMWRAPEQKLTSAVMLAGPPFEQRLAALRTGVRLFRRSRELEDAVRTSPIRAARRILEPLPRPGGDAALERLLLFAGGHRVFPVDPGAQRIALRLGLASASRDVRRTVRAARRAIVQELPRAIEAWRHASLYLSHHASATCADTDPHCSVCPLLNMCPEGQRRVSSATPRAGGVS
jgi:endonuclease III